MKARLTAGAEFDFVTKDEIDQVVTERLSYLVYGVQFRSIPLTQTSAALVQMQAGPQAGYMWDIRSVSVRKGSADVVQLWLNSVSDASFVCSVQDDGQNGNFVTFAKGAFVLHSSELVIIRALTATGPAAARLSVREVPAGHDWKL